MSTTRNFTVREERLINKLIREGVRPEYRRCPIQFNEGFAPPFPFGYQTPKDITIWVGAGWVLEKLLEAGALREPRYQKFVGDNAEGEAILSMLN